MEFHEAASLFPMITGDDYRALRDDIANKGLIEPVTLYEGKILDGRNRYTACLEIGLEPDYDEYTGSDPVGFVISKNLQRRHLTSSQRAVIALEVEKMLGGKARERQGTRTDLFQIIEKSDPIHAADQAAQLLGTNRQYVSDAKKIAQEAPNMLAKISSGEMTIPQVKRILRRDEQIEHVKSVIPPSGKYQILYADPPWQYQFGFDIHGAALRHYNTMSIDELCALPIKNIACEDAVLFLWVTSPKLADCFRVINAWGFEYKTSFVWDKVKHVMGHYNSVRHELLLICVRGSFPKQSNTLIDSVVTLERTDEHSEKPEKFREIIDQMYPYGKRIELFARNSVDGWDTWGAENGNS